MSDKPPPTAVAVKVIRARDLHNSSKLFNRMNPYVAVYLGSQKDTSNVDSRGGQFPEWNHTSTFTYAGEQSLRFKVIDKDTIGTDYIGAGEFTLGMISSSRQFQGEVPLTRKKGKPAGYVDIEVTFYGELGSGKSSSKPTATTAAKKDTAPPQQVASAPPVAPHPGPACAYQAAPYQQPGYQQPAYQQPQQQPARVQVVVGSPQQPPPQQQAPYPYPYPQQQQPYPYPQQQPYPGYPPQQQPYPYPQQQPYPYPQQQQPYPYPQQQPYPGYPPPRY